MSTVKIDHNRVLASIERETSAERLRQWASNLHKKDEEELADRARRRMYAVLATGEEGSLEYDVWRSIYALEDAIREERGKTVRLSRTRQKIARVGEHTTVVDSINSSKPAEGFTMLVQRGMIDLSFESIALKHPDRFTEATLSAARARLAASAS